MNCWIILLLLCCCGNNGGSNVNNGNCGCSCGGHGQNNCIQPRKHEYDECNVLEERECRGRDYDDDDSCACMGNGRDREHDMWTPVSGGRDDRKREKNRECREHDREHCDCGCSN